MREKNKREKDRENVCVFLTAEGNFNVFLLFVTTDFLMGTDIKKKCWWVAFVCSTGRIKYRKTQKKV